MRTNNIVFKISTLWMVAVAILFLGGCDKNETPGIPTINQIRSTTADSAISYANLGQTIAIVGNNLQTAKLVTFNGQQASFKATLITNKSIIVVVSKKTPFLGEEATDKVEIITDGGSATASLEITPPAPEILSVSPEYAGEGAEITVNGNYFYNIESVKIGDLSAEIIAVTPTNISVTVPIGYSKSKIAITSSKSGVGESVFDFGLDTGIVQLNWGNIKPSGDVWWNTSLDGPDTEFKPIGLPYKFVSSTYGNTWWTLDGGIKFDSNDYRKGNPETKAIKFEYSLIGNPTWLQVLWKSSLGEHKFIIEDLPPTAGKWATYTIKMSDFTLGDDGPAMTQEIFESDNPLLLQYAFVNPGDSDITVKCAMTNFRFVDF